MSVSVKTSIVTRLLRQSFRPDKFPPGLHLPRRSHPRPAQTPRVWRKWRTMRLSALSPSPFTRQASEFPVLVGRFFEEAQPAQLPETVQSLLVPQRANYVDQSLISDRAEQAEDETRDRWPGSHRYRRVLLPVRSCRGQLFGPVDVGENQARWRCA